MAPTIKRQPLVLGNWKMFGSVASVEALLAGLSQGLRGVAGDVERGICPPYVFLAAAQQTLSVAPEAACLLGAQDLSPCEAGAHTGDIAGEMLQELGCRFVLVGHSERRADHSETNEQVAAKYQRALASGLTPVLCVGESLEQREAGETLAVIQAQCEAVLNVLSAAEKADMLVAYEPVWAIGTGKTASPEQAQEVHAFIRELIASDGLRILYGGSVKPDNAAELFAQADIDGGLIGGASLEADSFIAIVKAASDIGQ